jgi:inosine-uridine nucleoside N-ribohydrolase
MAQHIARIVPFYQSYFERAYGTDGIYVHDSSAIACVIDPSLFTMERWPVRVETMGISRGKTWPNLDPGWLHCLVVALVNCCGRKLWAADRDGGGTVGHGDNLSP